MGRGQRRTNLNDRVVPTWAQALPAPRPPVPGTPIRCIVPSPRAARHSATKSDHRGFCLPGKRHRETRAGSAGACFGSGSDPSVQLPFPARQRHTRELRVISFPVVKWSKCVSMQDWGPGNHEETGFLFLLQTTAVPVDCCSNASFPQRRTWSWDFKFSLHRNDFVRNFSLKIKTWGKKERLKILPS